MSTHLTPLPAQPLVSVVINNFNYGRFLGQAVTSALNQSYPRVEVVVVDDGSTDDSTDVMRSFGDRIRCVFQPNGGQGSAYNAGFAASTGDFILFLDSDDFLAENALVEVVRAVKPGVAKIHFYLEIVKGLAAEPTGTVIPSTKLADGDLRQQILTKGGYAAPPASGNVYARSALAQILPVPEVTWRIAADTYPIFLAALLGTVRSCDKVLGYYRVHGSNNEFEVPFNGAKLRRRMKYEVDRDRMLAQYSQQHGLAYAKDGIQKEFNHLKARFASLALDPAAHPFKADRLPGLTAKLLAATWGDPGARFVKKMLLSAWMMALLAAPGRFKQKLVDIAFVPAIRSAGLSRSIRVSPLPSTDPST